MTRRASLPSDRPTRPPAPRPAAPAEGSRQPGQPGQFSNPVLDGGPKADHGDPYVLEHLGEYYLFHSGPRGIDAYRSDDLVRWEWAGTVLTGAGEGHWAQVELWAPEVVYQDGRFVMYVAATSPGVGRASAGKAHGADGGDDMLRRQGVARAPGPLGPYVWDDEPLVAEWSIDAHPFTDDDGSRWLFYNVRNDDTRHADGALGCGNVVDRVGPDGRLLGRPVQVAYPSQDWEAGPGGEQYWNEAPFTLKRRGRYYQMYSGGFFGGDGYAVGVSVADELTGPWEKTSSQPVFVSGEISGPGHHCVTVAPDGVTPYAVYHGYVADGFGRKVHLDRLWWAGDGPQVGRGRRRPTSATLDRQPVPPSAVHDPAVEAFALRAWVRGEHVDVDGLRVGLGGHHEHLLEVDSDGSTMTVRVDDALVATRRGPARPGLAGAEVLRSTVHSHLDDDGEHVLGTPARRSWAWGGSGPVECSVAVAGRARVQLGEQVVDVDGVGFELVTLRSGTGAEALHVVGLDGGARVADVVLDAR
ncbi:glycoside hydrolase family 43 protein [Aquipuribacter hungaricus]|uniref:Glycoside hydrolase family 43 protein n=1 Tax=Aquipuribacter hungaricus TaxID=545624 RepID=A0ABV7WJ80_9MICO